MSSPPGTNLQNTGTPHLDEMTILLYLERQLDRRLFNLRRHPVFQHRFTPRDLLQGGFAAFIVQLLKTIKAVAAVTHHPARLRDIAELFRQFQQSDLRPNYLLFCVIVPVPFPPRTLTVL